MTRHIVLRSNVIPWSDNILPAQYVTVELIEPGDTRNDRAQLIFEVDRSRAEISNLKSELKALRAFERCVHEALNSGDGAYRP